MKKWVVVVLGFLMVTVAIAKDHAREQHDAHEHGVAEVNIAWVGNDLSIEVDSPSYNIVGFEHQPNSTEQRNEVSRVMKVLQQPSQLFSIDNASCKVSKSQIESPFEENEKQHDDKHGHHGDKEHGESTHTEYSLHYEFACSEQQADLIIDFAALFKQFPNMQEVEVKWLSATQQSSEEITPNNTRLVLK